MFLDAHIVEPTVFLAPAGKKTSQIPCFGMWLLKTIGLYKVFRLEGAKSTILFMVFGIRQARVDAQPLQQRKGAKLYTKKCSVLIKPAMAMTW